MNFRAAVLASVLSLTIVSTAPAASETPKQIFDAGVATLKGNNVPQNTAKGRKLIEKAAKLGDPRAQVWAAVIHDHSATKKDQKIALKWAQMAAEQGHPVAQMIVGSHYLSGQGVDKDLQVAEDWLTRAANQGQRDAMMNLATLSAQEIGSTPGAAWSYYWTILAAQQKLPYAINVMKRMQALPPDEKALGEKRAGAFKPKLEKPDLFTTDDLLVPDVRPGRAPVALPSPSPTASPVPAPATSQSPVPVLEPKPEPKAAPKPKP